MERNHGEEGQGLVEYALILLLVAVVVIVMAALIWPAKPSQPPAMNAPLLEIVRYCEPMARDEHKHFNGKYTSTTYTDNPEKFLTCMQTYEYEVKR